MNAQDLSSILEPLRAQAESRIKQELSGSFNLGKRFLYDSIMPLHVNITADSQQCCLEFLPGGSVQLKRVSAPNPDVSVKGEFEILRNVVVQRSSRMFEDAERDGRISVAGHTWKGQQAMQKVRELLGSNPQRTPSTLFFMCAQYGRHAIALNSNARLSRMVELSPLFLLSPTDLLCYWRHS